VNRLCWSGAFETHFFIGTLHDPTSKPHDLDNPFHDSKAQERAGQAIVKAAENS
jgi:hypothetical protein